MKTACPYTREADTMMSNFDHVIDHTVAAYLHQLERHTCVRIIHGNKDAWLPVPSDAQPAIVVDGSGYAARLLVLPTFGCVLHEPKATES